MCILVYMFLLWVQATRMRISYTIFLSYASLYIVLFYCVVTTTARNAYTKSYRTIPMGVFFEVEPLLLRVPKQRFTIKLLSCALVFTFLASQRMPLSSLYLVFFLIIIIIVIIILQQILSLTLNIVHNEFNFFYLILWFAFWKIN